jgi:hypothetical protein
MLLSKILLNILLLTITALYSESLVFPPYLHSYGIRKATPKHLFMLLGASTQFNDPQGLATAMLESRDNPAVKKDDDEVVVYGVNSGRHEIIYNKSMYALAIYGKKGNGNGCFLFPKGVATNSKGDVFVADSGNNRIVHLFNPKEELLWNNSFNGSTASDPGIIGPLRVALDEDGSIYVTDAVHKKIFVFSKDQSVKMTIPPKNREDLFVDKPTALAIADGTARWSYYKNERVIFCADKNGSRLWKIDLNGSVVQHVQIPEGYHAFYGAVDFYHNYWITDIQKHCLLKFDHNLTLLDIFGSYGDKKDQFIEPRGITIYKRFGQVFIAEKKGAQYYWMGTQFNGAVLKNDSDQKYNLTVKSTEFSFVSLLSLIGKDTVYYCKRRMIVPPTDMIQYIDQEKKIGNHPLILKIEPTYSSYTYNSWTYPLSVLK